MIELPLICFIEKNIKSSVDVNFVEFNVKTKLKSTHVQYPNPLKQTLQLKYVGLSKSDSKIVEDALKGTYGTERISYSNKKYKLKNYKATYNNSVVSLELELEQVA